MSNSDSKSLMKHKQDKYKEIHIKTHHNQIAQTFFPISYVIPSAVGHVHILIQFLAL